MNKNLHKLFSPSAIAVVGASEVSGKIGTVISNNLLKLGYEGEIYFVNPKYETLFEKKCYKSLEEVDGEVDLAIVAIPAKFVIETVRSAAHKVKNFVVISAGFSEIGKEGEAYEEELLNLAKENGLNILGPNCLGFINPKNKLNASFAGGMPEEGNVALVSQSGALAVALMDVSKKEKIKFSSVVSVGNKMQIDESGLIEYFGEDDSTKVVALYLEGIEDGGKFIEVAKKVSAKKPIIVLKAGKSEKAQKAIASHTGALAGSDDIMNVAFEKSGIVRASNLEEFFDLVKVFSNFEYQGNENSAIITNAGGPGVLATDEFQSKSIKLANLNQSTKDGLREFLPEESSVENPVDLLGDAREDRYKKALEVLENEDIENVFCIMTAQDQTPVKSIAQEIVDFNKKSSKNAIPVFIGGEKMKEALEVLENNNIPNFSFPKNAIDAFDKYLKWVSDFKGKTVGDVSSVTGDEAREKKSQEIISDAKNSGRSALLFGEVAEIMHLYGISTVGFVNLKPEDEIGSDWILGFPVVVKVDSDKVLHKTDKKGLVLGIEDMEGLMDAVDEIRGNFPGENVIVQSMIKSEAELILGMKNDSIFGPVLVYGLGGIYTEVFKMIDFIVLPSTQEEIRESLLKGRSNFLFKETRGKILCDLNKMAELIFNFASFVQENRNVSGVDINPLLIDKSGNLIAVDVKIIL